MLRLNKTITAIRPSGCASKSIIDPGYIYAPYIPIMRGTVLIELKRITRMKKIDSILNG